MLTLRSMTAGGLLMFIAGCGGTNAPPAPAPPAPLVEKEETPASSAGKIDGEPAEVVEPIETSTPTAMGAPPAPLTAEQLAQLAIELRNKDLMIGMLPVTLRKTPIQTLIDYLASEVTHVEQEGRYDAYVFNQLGFRCLVLRETSAITFVDVTLAREAGAELAETDPGELFSGKMTIFGVAVTPATKRVDFSEKGIEPRDNSQDDGFWVNNDDVSAILNHRENDPSEITSVRFSVN